MRKMKIAEPKAKNTQTQRQFPKRGGVKRKILKEIAVACRYVVGAGGAREKHAEECGGGGFLSSDFTTPNPSPTGYLSDALSET